MNILWIINHDVSAPDFGCYGNDLARTPNIDRLAAEGARFENAFTTCPVCAPARSGVHTGMYPTAIDAQNMRCHRTDKYRPPGDVKLVSERLNEAGWHTVLLPRKDLGTNADLDVNFHCDSHFAGDDWNRRKPGQRFFAVAQLFEPHRTRIQEEKYCLSRKGKIDCYFSSEQFAPDPVSANEVKLPPYYPDHPAARQDWADYLNSIQVLDLKVGRILKQLERDGLAENTAVFYLADHGRAHLRDKRFLYDGGIHVPLIVRFPGGPFAAGHVESGMVSTVDVAASTLDIAGVPLPQNMHGRSFFDDNWRERKEVFAGRDRIDEAVDRIRCVRSKDYKYIKNFMPEKPWTQYTYTVENYFPMLPLMREMKAKGQLPREAAGFLADRKPPEELYDLRKDPFELNNLVKDKSYAKVLSKMRGLLENWIVETNDAGAVPEPETVIQKECNFWGIKYPVTEEEAE